MCALDHAHTRARARRHPPTSGYVESSADYVDAISALNIGFVLLQALYVSYM